jgi:hypothetical protein
MSEEATPGAARSLPLRLVWGMIVRPRETLEHLNDSGGRSWFLPALLAAIFVVLPVVAAAPITVEQTRETVLAGLERTGQQSGEGELSAEQEARVEQMTGIAASPLITVVLPALGSLVVRAVGWLSWAGALHLAATTIGGASGFGHMFRTVVWAWLPYTIRGLVQTVYILASGQLIVYPGLSGLLRAGSSGAGELATVPSLGQTIVGSLLSRIDVYMVWNLVLLVLGVMVTSRLARRKATLMTLGVWVILTAIVVIPSALVVLFAGQAGAIY